MVGMMRNWQDISTGLLSCTYWSKAVAKQGTVEHLPFTHATTEDESGILESPKFLSKGFLDICTECWHRPNCKFVAGSYFAWDESTSESTAESPTQQADLILNSYGDYEDSVYGLAWCSREPCIFASLSYDGRVVVESVKPFFSRK